jgi:hypothetical protein
VRGIYLKLAANEMDQVILCAIEPLVVFFMDSLGLKRKHTTISGYILESRADFNPVIKQI